MKYFNREVSSKSIGWKSNKNSKIFFYLIKCRINLQKKSRSQVEQKTKRRSMKDIGFVLPSNDQLVFELPYKEFTVRTVKICNSLFNFKCYIRNLPRRLLRFKD